MKKLRLALGLLMLISPIYILSAGYRSNKFYIYLILSLPLLIKGFCEVLRYFTHKGIKSYDNYLLYNLKELHRFILWVSFILALCIPSFIWLDMAYPMKIKNTIGSPQPILFITMLSLFAFAILTIIDYFILKSKKYADEENIRQSGKAGETKVINALDSFCKHNSSYEYFHNILLKYQEFDSILVGEKGIFNIEVKNFSGEKTIIHIEPNGSWFKEKYGKIVSVPNPIEQVQRHHEVLESLFHGQYPIYDILVIANSENTIIGSKNTPLHLVKLDALPDYVSNYKNNRKLTSREVSQIIDIIEEHKQSHRESNY